MPEVYNGKIVVPSAGPLDAELLIVGESPAFNEVQKGVPFVGAAGNVLNKALARAAIDRSKVRIVNLVPVRAPEDKFHKHDAATLEWGLQRFEAELAALPNIKVAIALGANPLRYLTGIPGNITDWRGSVLRPDHWPLKDISIAAKHPWAVLQRPFVIVPTFHPAAVARRYKWLWPFMEDVARAKAVLEGRWQPPAPRKWYINRLDLLPKFVEKIIEQEKLVALDSEMLPYFIVALASEDEVHAFAWSEEAAAPLEKLLTNPNVIKVAHNWNHDATFMKKVLRVNIAPPLFDTMGGAHLLDPEREKDLEPGISTRFETGWPYHKWLSDYDPVVYCGMDAAVCYDAYWPIVGQLSERGMLKLAQHDHKLLWHLLEMQWEGIPVDVVQRIKTEHQLHEELRVEEQKLEELVWPVVKQKLHRFKKPHLFRIEKQCECCGGGKQSGQHCWRCGGLSKKPERKDDYAELGCDLKQYKVAELKAMLPACGTCNGTGKVEVWKDFNPESSEQLADVIYRGLGIKARKYKGQETTRKERLEAIKNPPELVKQVIKVQGIRADYETIKRLTPAADGKLHCVFDPWGTVSGRVAGKEGLIEVGTNPMNLPYEARKMIVAPEGYGFMYPDMAQIEARAVAVLGNEQKLIEIYRSGGDSHTAVMNLIKERTGFDMNDVNVGPHAGEGRHLTKRSVYAFMYGIRPPHLAGELGLTEELAAEILQALAVTFPGVARYKEQVAAKLYDTRTAFSPTGRVRIFRDRIYDPKTKDVSYEIKKKAWSFAPQDMAAYILAKGLFCIREKYPWISPRVHVHDALLMLFPLERRDEAVKAGADCLTREEWGMLFESGMSIGPDWYVATKSDKWKRENGYAEWVVED